MAETTTSEAAPNKGVSRREVIKKGAVVGATLMWVAPAIQSIGTKAFAAGGLGFTCCSCNGGGGKVGKQDCGGPHDEETCSGTFGSSCTRCKGSIAIGGINSCTNCKDACTAVGQGY